MDEAQSDIRPENKPIDLSKCTSRLDKISENIRTKNDEIDYADSVRSDHEKLENDLIHESNNILHTKEDYKFYKKITNSDTLILTKALVTCNSSAVEDQCDLADNKNDCDSMVNSDDDFEHPVDLSKFAEVLVNEECNEQDVVLEDAADEDENEDHDHVDMADFTEVIVKEDDVKTELNEEESSHSNSGRH